MKIIYCRNCKQEIARGEMKQVETPRGRKWKFYIDTLNGTIIKNHSSNPSNWSGLCPEHQRQNEKMPIPITA
jgi:hypothetical protein